MTRQQANLLHEVKSWITPALVVVIGYLAKTEFERINAKIDSIYSIENRVTIVEYKITQDEKAIEEIAGRISEKLPAKHEEEITATTKTK
jgi:GTP1/Obg family GTP-binding protein